MVWIDFIVAGENTMFPRALAALPLGFTNEPRNLSVAGAGVCAADFLPALFITIKFGQHKSQHFRTSFCLAYGESYINACARLRTREGTSLPFRL